MATDPSPGTRSRLALGRAGERVAARYLEGLGYRVVGAGFLARRGEIDLVCRLGDKLVVVEVKTRTSDRCGTPAEAVGRRKLRALARAGAEYRALARWHGPVEYAVVAVHMGADGQVREVELITEPF